MIYYYIPIFITVFFTFFNKKLYIRNGRKKRIIDASFLTVTTILFFFAALRGDGSGDYWTYLERGASIKEFKDIFNNNIHLDVGYCFLAWIVNVLKLPAQVVIALMNFISISCISFSIKKYSKFPILSLLVFLTFYFQFDMHASRTADAIAIVTLTIPFIIERKPLKFFLCIILASLFHPVALIGIMLYFFPQFSINKKVGLLLLGVESILASLGVLDAIFINMLNRPIFHYAGSRILGYTTSTEYGYAFKLYDPRLLLLILLFLVSKKKKNEKKEDVKLRNLFINATFFAAFIMIFFSKHTFITYRFSAIYNIFTIFLVPLICSDVICGRNKQYISKFQQYYLTAILGYTMLNAAYVLNSSVPYKIFKIVYWK